ncbi:MAG: putative transposase/invertase (TIGR01784 family) [Phenylobacterium sp.]|jgi:predicted transposase/invertase (TIGR01784 family)
MKHLINPTIDCVFKAILGAKENINLLIHFLNGILQPLSPIIDVVIENPYNERDYIDDKLTVVDIKATDGNKTTYQVEVQLSTPGHLKNRMLFTWADIYQAQLKSGHVFGKLKPVISIWLLTETIFPDLNKCHHHFQLRDNDNQQLLTDQCSIHVLELSKWQQPDTLQPQDEWLYFFKEAQNWAELPEQLNSPQMRQAMNVLEEFSEKEASYHVYKSRLNALRVQLSMQQELEEECQLRAQAQTRAEKAEAEQHRLLALLQQAGVDPS